MNKYDRNKLRRKTFDKAIDDAFADYLNGAESYLGDYPVFVPSDTPNRNPKQVPQGVWCRLIYKHINKIHYN
jgi:hypothetical protein